MNSSDVPFDDQRRERSDSAGSDRPSVRRNGAPRRGAAGNRGAGQGNTRRGSSDSNGSRSASSRAASSPSRGGGRPAPKDSRLQGSSGAGGRHEGPSTGGRRRPGAQERSGRPAGERRYGDDRPRSGGARREGTQERSGRPAGERRYGDDRPRSGGARREGTQERSGRPAGERRYGDDRPRERDREEVEERRRVPPGLEPAENEPELPAGYDETGLPGPLRAELRGLNKSLAGRVGGHLRAVGELVDSDPQLALRHALVARRLASRLPVVREVTADTAYAAEDYETALTEYRAIHRMSGNDDYLPVIADCERAVGKHQAALRTLRQAREAKLSVPQQVEVILVEAGIRDDLGQRPEALRLLKDAISGGRGGRDGQARLRFAYANLLAATGRVEAAREWLVSASHYDDQDALGVGEAIAELDGVAVTDDVLDDEFEVIDIEVIEEEPAGDEADQYLTTEEDQ